MSEGEKLFWNLVKIGLVSTLVSIPIGLFLVPQFKDKPWVPAMVLTAAGYAVKSYMLPHETATEGS